MTRRAVLASDDKISAITLSHNRLLLPLGGCGRIRRGFVDNSNRIGSVAAAAPSLDRPVAPELISTSTSTTPSTPSLPATSRPSRTPVLGSTVSPSIPRARKALPRAEPGRQHDTGNDTP